MAVVILVHISLHLDWIECAVSRFFSKSAGKVRIYSFIDVLLLFGFFLLGASGLLISTWLNLTWIDYESWREIHIFTAVATLSLTIIKLALHRNWIISATRKVFSSANAAFPAGTSPQSVAVSRRQFLAAMGLIGLASAVAVHNVLPGLLGSDSQNDQATDQGSQSLTTTQPAASAATPADASANPVATDSPAPEPTTQPTAAPSATTQAIAVENCRLSCRRGNHCSFPGICHSYRDMNNNGLCDLGECA